MSDHAGSPSPQGTARAEQPGARFLRNGFSGGGIPSSTAPPAVSDSRRGQETNQQNHPPQPGGGNNGFGLGHAGFFVLGAATYAAGAYSGEGFSWSGDRYGKQWFCCRCGFQGNNDPKSLSPIISHCWECQHENCEHCKVLEKLEGPSSPLEAEAEAEAEAGAEEEAGAENRYDNNGGYSLRKVLVDRWEAMRMW